MPSLRQYLLSWFPFLAAWHKALHSRRENAERSFARFRQKLNRIRCTVFWERRIARAARHAGGNKSVKPVVHLYAVCWNEAWIVPYFMDYYSDFVDEFTIYENMSSDSTVALLSQHRNVTVIPYDTGNTFDDAVNMEIKNSAWKRSRGRADFVIVCDMDEFVYHPEMRSLLHHLKQGRFTLVKPHGYNMVSRTLPDFDGCQKITRLIRQGVDAGKNYSKTILFSPALDDIHFSPGSHKSSPVGRIKTFESDHVKLLHYKFVDRDLVLAKTREYRIRLSETNRKQGWGKHYLKTDEEALAEFDRIVSRGRVVI